MATIHLKSNMKGDFIAPDKRKSKAKPKVIVIPESLKQYFLERDRIIYKTTTNMETKQAILERYGKG